MCTETGEAILARSAVGALKTLARLRDVMGETDRLLRGRHPEAMPPVAVAAAVRCYSLARNDLDLCLRVLERELGPFDGLNPERLAELAGRTGTEWTNNRC